MNPTSAGYAELDEPYPRGSHERHVLPEPFGFYKGAAVLVSRRLLHEDPLVDAPFAFELVWHKMAGMLEELQVAIDDPAAWENDMWLGLLYEAWFQAVSRPKPDAVPPERGASITERP